MSERAPLSPAASAALVRLGRALLSSARTRALYPAEHPVVAASVVRLQRAIADAADAQVAGAIGVTPTTLIVDGADEPGDSIISEAAAFLHARGIVEIGFARDVTADDLQHLLVFLVAPHDVTDSRFGERGCPAAIRLTLIDYAKLVENHELDRPAARRDDIWRALVSAFKSGRRALDEREQERLLEIAGDRGELAALAKTLVAEQCTPDGAPLLATQAATLLNSFRNLASLAAVLAPVRAQAVLANLATALLDLDPHLSLQVFSLDAQTETPHAPAITGALGEEGVARLLAAVVALEGHASLRLVEVFGLLVPDRSRRRDVLGRARAIAEAKHVGGQRFDAFWHSVEELLLAYDDQPFVSDEYRALLDASLAPNGHARDVTSANLGDWVASVEEDGIRDLSILLLSDLLDLEARPDRAVSVLNHLADLVDDFLMAGAYRDALRVLDAIERARHRDELAIAAAQSLERIASGSGVRETAAAIGGLGENEWQLGSACCAGIGARCLVALEAVLTSSADTLATRRAGDLAVAIGADAVPFLARLLERRSTETAARDSECSRRRIVAILGRIGSPAAVPALQALARSPEPEVVRDAVRALAGIDHPSAVRAINLALRSTDEARRQTIVDGLVSARDRHVVPMLVRVLRDCRPLAGDFQVALNTLYACARFKDPRAVPAVVPLMFLSSWLSWRRLRALKRAAVRALGEIGDASALQALENASRSRDRALRAIIRSQARVAAGAA